MNPKILAGIIIALAVLGCVQHVSEHSAKTVKYAKYFDIEYHKDYKILRVRYDGKWTDYILYKNKKPDVAGIPIKIPVKRIILMSSTHVAQLEAINATDCISGIMWGGRYKWYFKDIEERLKKGKIADVGTPSAPDYEKILELKPDLVVIYVTEYNENVRRKLEELKIPYIIDSEWKETDPLGRAEWVKFFGALTDRDEMANEYFSKIEKNIMEIYSSINDTERPKLLWFSIWKGNVYVPRGGSYVAKAVEYAKADYVFRDLNGSGSAKITLEDLLLKGNDTDVAVYSSYTVKSIEDLLRIDSRLSEIKAIRDGRIYRISDDYWQLGILHPDVIVKDLAAMCHPDKFQGYKPRFFIRLT
ncbi:ABC transporter substrate-binding protein [Archaeoglobus neptunius]|uniref:ABC transporter substrate-binding protein n=1 Tax=Archaeoglobus neptunius TaxID=2798580 RepID=UPI001926A6D4|nr:ABC transporter substrate-binding protein [Archaeoglobus neptunius]